LRSILRTVRWLRRPYAVLDAARSRHGLTFWLDLAFAGRSLVTGEPALVREIMGHPDLDAGRGIAALRPMLGDRSLITLDGEDHLARRRIVAPLFRRELERLDAATVEAAMAAARAITPGEPFSVYDLTRRISLAAIVRLLFGEAPAVEALVDAFFHSFASPWVLFLKPLHVDLGPRSPWGRALRNRRRLEEELRARIAACRRGEGAGGLARIVEGGADLEDDDFVSEILALLLFGHDTGAATLAWAFAHLHAHPQTLARARQEPPYLEACLLESMRLCPVVVHVTRVARRDLRLGSHDVPAGARVLPSAYLAQRNPEVFPEPDRFQPERFLDGASYDGAYFPFGFSPRTCIGRPFVMRQMTLVTSTLLRHLDLALLPGGEGRPERRLVLILPRGGTPMVAA
jgi:cytochrome P450